MFHTKTGPPATRLHGIVMQMLFIGGHRNGARIHCEGNQYVRLPVPCDMEMSVDAPLKEIEFEEYRKERISGQVSEFSVYVSTSITIDDALRMMIDSYSA
jgi:hypothetical protein